MKLLVGIPSFRRPAMLAALLRSIAMQDGVEGITVSVFVADNDPHDAEAVALCAAMRADYPCSLTAAIVAESGISAARNRILEEARATGADAIAMIDDDETASPRWLAELTAARTRYGADIIGGSVEFHFAEAAAPALVSSGAFTPKRGVSGPIAMLNATSNVLIDAAALSRIGWPRFDPAFGRSGGEDKEWFTRLQRAGLRFAWADEALVFEAIPSARMRTRAIARRAYGIGGSDYRIARLHGDRRDRRAHLARSAAALTAGLILAPAIVIPRYRLWLVRRVARAAGRLSAAVGRTYTHYGTISP